MDYYTDWSCLWNPGKWWRCYVTTDGRYDGWNKPHTTNNEMEITAIFHAVKAADHNDRIYTDSLRAVNVISWRRKPKMYRDIIEKIRSTIDQFDIKIYRVKWHDKNAMNEKADRGAKYYANQINLYK